MIRFAIPGNQEDPRGNPLGYTRTTTRGKFVNPKALRYAAWKDYVWRCLLKACPNPPRYEVGEKVVVSSCVEFRGDARRPDPSNVTKGITDALQDVRLRRRGVVIYREERLYPTDRCVMEQTTGYDYSDWPVTLVEVRPGRREEQAV